MKVERRMKPVGLILIAIGFLAIFAGAGTSDMEIELASKAIDMGIATTTAPRLFTGIPMAVAGLLLVVGGMIAARPR